MTGAEKRRPGRTELSDDLRCHVINAVAGNNTDKRLGPGMASALRRLQRVETGEMSWAPTGGDRRLGRIEAHRNYQLGVAHRQPDMTLQEIREQSIAECGERFSSSVISRFFDRHPIMLKKSAHADELRRAQTS